MKDVAGQGRTVLFVSHNMLAVKSLCTLGIWLEKGRNNEIGKIESVVGSYLSTISQNVASFKLIEQESKGLILHSIQVSNNGISGNFNIEVDLIFEIKVSTNNDYDSINVNIFFNTIEGIVIFAVCSPPEKLGKGSYSFRCTVPANTLNDIIYNIDLMIVEEGPKIVHHLKEIISIEGVEEKRIGAWLGKFPGLIRPLSFKWKKIKHDEQF